MKKMMKLLGIAAAAAIMIFGFTACKDPVSGSTNQTPVAADYDITGLTQTYDGTAKAVTISPKTGKSTGTRTVFYEGTATDGSIYVKGTTAPSAAGKYTVTFDVAAATGWDAAKGLVAGTLTIGTGNGRLVISGTLSSAQRRRFSLAVLPTATQTFSVELGSDNKTLSGKLKDGSITFELSGEYDTSTKVFSVQAPSSFMVFSIVGKLDAGNAIDTGSTSASVKLKDEGSGEWTNTDLTVTPSSQTVEGAVTATGGTSIPDYCRGTFADQILENLRYAVTKNSITMIDGNNPPVDFTVVEITNADGTPADENGPWHLIVVGKWRVPGGDLKDYTGKFYVSKTFDTTLTTAIGNATMSDLYFGDYTDSTLLSDAAVSRLSGIKMFVTPYCANIPDVIKGEGNGVYPDDGYSPMFTGAQATAKAKDAGNILKAKSGFVLALK